MTFLTILWVLTVFWTAIYSLNARAGRSTDILPTTSASSPSRTTHYRPKRWQIIVQNLHLRAETSSLNELHDELAQNLSRRKILSAGLTRFYDLGILFGVLGFIAGFIVLGFSSHHIIVQYMDSNPEKTYRLAKRALDGIPDSAVVPSQFTVQPIIPGVTVPWSHLPVLLIALFLAQCIHEAGHAVAAAIDNLPLNSIGFSLTLALPSAFVALSPSLHNLKHAARQRITVAGAWHNLVLWILIYLASSIIGDTLWRRLGWHDISDVGRVVLNIESDSPLYGHIRPGDIVYAIDDTRLSAVGPSGGDAWAELLQDDASDRPLQSGWCVREDWFQSQPTACCSRSSRKLNSQTPYLSCFVPFTDDPSVANGHCINPVPVMTPTTTQSPELRCSQSSDCDLDPTEYGGTTLCVVPDLDVELTRISVGPPIWSKEETELHLNATTVVLWSGPRSEIWDEVSVGVLAPTSRLLPTALPNLVSLFLEYLSTLSLSLYLFNLFCLPFLDGSLFFSALLDSIGGAREPNETMSPEIGTDLHSEDWLRERNLDERYSFESDLELGSMELPRRRLVSPPPSSWSRTSRSRHRPVHLLLQFVLQRCRWEVRYRKHAIEMMVRVATIGLISFVILGMIWTQKWKDT